MDNVIKTLNEQYTKVKKENDGVYSIALPSNVGDERKGENFAINFSTLDIDKMIHSIKSSHKLRVDYFSNALYKQLDKDKFTKIINGILIPSSSIEKVVSYIYTSNFKKKEELIQIVIEKNVSSITESIITQIMTNTSVGLSDKTIKILLENIDIDIDYMIHIIKEEENFFDSFSVEALGKFNNALSQNTLLSWINFIKNLNTIYYLNKKINEETIEKYQEKIENLLNDIKRSNDEKIIQRAKEVKEIDFELISRIAKSGNVITEKINI